MAKIVDPDSLNQATEVVISTAAKTVQLLVAGNLDDTSPGATSGATKQAVYSFLKEEWETDNNLNKFTFPLKAFTKNEFLWQNGWAPADAQTRELFRDAGWQESVGAQAGDLYAGMISLGGFDATADQGYYAQVAGFDQTTANFDKTGEVNEAILIFDADGADRTDYFKAFLREPSKKYASYNLLTEQNIPFLEATLYRFPLENSVDNNITETDVNIDANAPYTGMSLDYLTGNHDTVTTWAATTAYSVGDIVQVSGGAYDGRFLRATVAGTSGASAPTGPGTDGGVTWEADPGERLIGSTYYHFSRIIDANTTAVRGEIYNWGMRQLRKTTDINANTNGDAFGTVNGNLADVLFQGDGFRGDDLVLAEGVYVDDFASTEINNLVFQPHPVDAALLAEVTFPFEVVVTLTFSSNIVNEVDTDTRVVAYFTNDDAGDNAGNDFDTSGAIIVQDNTPTNIDFDGTGLTGSTYTFSYDYDGNVQRGAASGGEDAPITLQVVGLSGFEIFTQEFTITRVPTLAVSVNGSDERNYSNPV